jgi:hypothetical protein
MEVKPEYKHCVRTDHKHRSRDYHKGKSKSERRPRKSGGHKKKERVMVAGVSDIESRSFYSSSSSSDEDENRHKGKRSSKNINGLCFAAQGFCGMAHSSASKKSNKDESDSDSKDEVNNDPDFLVLTRKVHSTPITQQAEQSWLHTRRERKTCQSIFPDN